MNYMWPVRTCLNMFYLTSGVGLLRVPWNFKEIKPVNPKGNQSGTFFGRTDAKAETPILWPPDAKNWLTRKDPAAGKDWRREGAKRGWGGWMALLTQWTWVWVSSGSWWWTGKPGVLQSMGSERVGHDWVTGLNRTDTYLWFMYIST